MCKSTTYLLPLQEFLKNSKYSLADYRVKPFKLVKPYFSRFLDSPLGVGSKRALAIPLVYTRNVRPFFSIGAF